MEVLLSAENRHHYQHLIKKLKSFLDAKLFTNLSISIENDNYEHSLHFLIFSAFCTLSSSYGQIFNIQNGFNHDLSLNEKPHIIGIAIELLYSGVAHIHHEEINYIQETLKHLNMVTSFTAESKEITKIEIPKHKDLLLDYIWKARKMKVYCDLLFITKDFKQNSAHYEIFAIYSKRFEKIYKTRHDRSRPLVLVLQNIENEHLELLIEYCYKGSITFTQEKAEKLNHINNCLGVHLTLEMTDGGCRFKQMGNNFMNSDVVCIERPPSKPKAVIVDLINNNKNCGNCYIWHEQKCIMVHAIVMKTFCPFLKKIYEIVDWTEKDVAVIINDFTYMELKAIVDFIYTGEANLVVDEIGIGSELLHWLGLTLSVFPESNESHKNSIVGFESIDNGNKIKSEGLSVEKKNYLNISCLPSGQEYELKENRDLKPNICSECEMEFKNERSLKIHVKTHYPEIYRCKQCEKIFLKRYNLKRHENLHKAPEHQCEICGKCFGSKDYMIEHKRSHTGEKPFMCPICFKRFTGKTGLNHHTKTHDKKHCILVVCDICGKKFTRQGLWGHMKTHKKEYRCEICTNKSFATPSALKRHVKWVHEKHPILKCSFCQEEYEQKSQLDRHMINAHYYHNGEFIKRKQYACNKCSQSFHTSVRLQKHVAKRHSSRDLLPCNICGKLLSGSSAIKYHIRSHTGERPHSCIFCPKNFTRPDLLKKHMRIHTGERFICPICSKSFTSKHYLTEHSWSHNIFIDPEKCKTEARLPEHATILARNSIQSTKPSMNDKYLSTSDLVRDHQKENVQNGKFDMLETPTFQLMDDVISKDNLYQSFPHEGSLPSCDLTKEHQTSCFISKTSYICSNCELLFDSREELNSHYLYCQPIF